MGNPAHKEFIKKLRLQQHQKEESSSKNVSKKLYSDCFDEDDDLFREELEAKWQELFGDVTTDDNSEGE